MRPKNYFPLNLQMFAEDEKEKKQPEEKKPEVEEAESAAKLAKALQEVKANSVSKSEYERLKKENHDLTKAIIEGTPREVSNKPEEKKPEIKELARACLEDGISNYEMAKRQLAYREAVIEQKGKDPFVPNKPNISQNDYERAEAVATAYKECITECEGNPEVFDALLASRIKNDDPVMLAAMQRKRK